jgi:broad specificity phosphatase PhoE
MRSQKIKHPLKNKYALLRHGQTDANGQKIYMGRLDFDLNDTGTNQAKETILPFAPDVVLHSPLKRAKQTADLATKAHAATPAPDERLLEKAGGDIDGLQYSEIAQKYPKVWGVWEDNSLEYVVEATFPGGESDLDVANRLEDLLAELEATHQGKNILLVTHSGVIQAARYLFGQSKEAIYFEPVPNCRVELYE